MVTKINPCPCGKTPTKIYSQAESGNKPKWAYACGNCCSEWCIEFRNGWRELGSPESDTLAIEAWNDATRKTLPETIEEA